MTWTIDNVISRLPSPGVAELPAPTYCYQANGYRLGLAVESMKYHMTDEGWQIFDGLMHGGYELAGFNLPLPLTDLNDILRERPSPAVVVVQDKREWFHRPRDFREPRARFRNMLELCKHPEIFTLTILKDSHQNPPFHIESSLEIACNAWIVYYHPRIVKHLAPYVRLRHLIRTYHTLDALKLPPLPPAENRKGALVSGAISGAYPLRLRIVRQAHQLPKDVRILTHPGYHRNGCATYQFMNELTKYRVAVCTSSQYGYALRKLVEATACGCRVVTDLPVDEVMPEIDGNLIRIRPDISIPDLVSVIQDAADTYDQDIQSLYAKAAARRYDFRVEGTRLANEIELLRQEVEL